MVWYGTIPTYDVRPVSFRPSVHLADGSLERQTMTRRRI